MQGKAQVHVVIIGLDKRKNARTPKRLFSYPDIKGNPIETKCKAISPYLIDASNFTNPNFVVQDSALPLSTRSKMAFGNMPNDGGHLILSSKEATEIKSINNSIEDFIRPLIGAKDLCLTIIDTAFG